MHQEVSEQVDPIVEKASELQQEVVAVEPRVEEELVEAIVEEISAPVELNNTASVCQ